MKALIRAVALTTLVLTANAMFAGSKSAPDFSKFQPAALVDVIVQFKSPPTSADSLLLGQSSSNAQKTLKTIKAIRIKVPAVAVQFIAAIPTVAYVSPVRPVSLSLDVVTATVNAANLAQQYGWDGSGVGVAIIDSGIAPKDDLRDAKGVKSRVVYSESFVSGTDTSDQYGHGTHVAGIVGANGFDSTGRLFGRTFRGVAPNVNLINLRVLDANGGGQESDVIDAIERAIQLKATYNIRVINLSLGRPVFESYALDPLCQAVEAAWKAGIVVVTAAGN